MSHTDDKIVYPKLQGATNYRSWKLNMISLFKRDQAHEIATGTEPKPATPTYQKNLTKLQFKDKLTTASAPGSTTTVTPQSGDSTVTTEAAAAAAATAATAAAAASAAQRPPLSRDDIEDVYQSYI